MKLPFRIVDVFTDRALTGNQLAVVLEADGLDAVAMQAVAREFNFSETTFVMASSRPGCDWRVRIFTPELELPMAGHPTIGTAVALRREGRIGERATFELNVGPTPVEATAGSAWMTQRTPEFLALQPDREALARALGVQPDDILADPPAQVVSTGNQFLMVPMATLDALVRIAPDYGEWAPVSTVSDLGGAYCFVHDGAGAVRARMLASTVPHEDPATGSAAGPLGAYLRRHAGVDRLVIAQGVEMGRPSRIEVDASGDGPRVGGGAVVVATGELELP